jgi:hypothetical protein
VLALFPLMPGAEIVARGFGGSLQQMRLPIRSSAGGEIVVTRSENFSALTENTKAFFIEARQPRRRHQRHRGDRAHR